MWNFSGSDIINVGGTADKFLDSKHHVTMRHTPLLKFNHSYLPINFFNIIFSADIGQDIFLLQVKNLTDDVWTIIWCLVWFYLYHHFGTLGIHYYSDEKCWFPLCCYYCHCILVFGIIPSFAACITCWKYCISHTILNTVTSYCILHSLV